MKKTHLNIFIPQWQGGGAGVITHTGASELRARYLTDAAEIDVATGKRSATRNDIAGYDELLHQLKLAGERITGIRPDTIFTLGGGCDSDIIPISYLNDLTAGDMTLVYFDAHGDLNTPESSGSKNFFGMCLRTLLGDGDPGFTGALFSTLSAGQVVLLGGRDFDEPESEYIYGHKVSIVSVADIEADVESAVRAAQAKGSRNIYIHIDLDVLDPEEFTIVGVGLLEYSPPGNADSEVIREIVGLGKGL